MQSIKREEVGQTQTAPDALGVPGWVVSAIILMVSVTVGAMLGDRWLHGEEPTGVLGGADRFSLHVSTDKPFYRPGETAYFRAVALDAFRNTPFTQDRRYVPVRVLGTKGETVFEGISQMFSGAIGISWKIPAEAVGGQYKIVFSKDGPFAPAERGFEVRAYRAPKMRGQLEFARKGYGPGDSVSISAKVTRAEGGVPSGAKATAIARVDGEVVHQAVSAVDSDGVCGASFDLPKSIVRGEGTFTFVIEDGGVLESFSKTIPILLQKLDINVYPEGGELVAGLTGGLYVEAFTPWGDPADMSADVVDDAGTTVATVRTTHEGRGKTSFKPTVGRKYRLQVTSPAGITASPELPEVRASGALIRSDKPVFVGGEGVSITTAAAAAGDYRLSLYRLEREISTVWVSLDAGVERTVAMTPPGDVAGVLRATLFDADDKPLAERLVFRAPVHGMKVELSADKEVYVPGESVTVTIKTSDHRGRPLSGVVGVTVTDDAVLEMVESRRKSPRLLAMALLEADVKELRDAHVYLDGTEKGNAAIDLLLGTQGWRRFAFMDVKSFLAKHGDLAKRATAHMVPIEHWGPNTGLGFGGGAGGLRGRLRDGGVEAEAGRAGADADDAVEAPPAAAAPQADEAVKRGEAAKNDPGAADKPGEAGAAVVEEMDEVVGGVAPEERGDDDGPADRRMRERARRIGPRPQPNAHYAVIREYSHTGRAGRKDGERRDFTETLYWHAGISTGQDGTASFTFTLSDSITSFRVMADGYSPRGQLGSADLLVESRQPFAIEPKFPLEVTQGDRIDLPVAIVSNMASSVSYELTYDFGAAVRFEGHVDAIQQSLRGELGPRGRGLASFSLRVIAQPGTYPMRITATSGPFTDSVVRSLVVMPYGFPISLSSGGMLKAEPQVRAVTIPDTVVPGSVRASVKVYPTPMASLTAALEALIREPYGCFEQASSVVYPMVMAQQYFKSHVGVDPALISKANTHIESGYKRLMGYASRDGGYEWFGASPGHEALTAYGVLQFADMAQVYPVDQGMVDRTRQWLVSRRDGKGGFLRNARALDSFGGAPDDITNAYIVWSLTETGHSQLLEAEIAALKKQAESSSDSYFLGLVAGVLWNSGDRDAAVGLMRKITGNQQPDGSVTRAVTTITRSAGDALLIETTSVAILAWLKDDQFTERTERAMQWLSSRCQNGRFGSTQSTILALKAIVAYDKARATPKKPGALVLTLDGSPIGTVNFDEKTKGVIEMPDLSALLTPGRHELSLSMLDGSPMPFSFQVTYHADTPASAAACKVQITTELSVATSEGGFASVPEGQSVDLRVSVRNLTKDGLPMTTAIVGLPGGLEPRHDQLRELVGAGTISFYEVRGREVIVYFRDMAPEKVADFRIDCVAAIPGLYTGPASRAYLYYTDEHKHWVDGLKVVVTGRKR